MFVHFYMDNQQKMICTCNLLKIIIRILRCHIANVWSCKNLLYLFKYAWKSCANYLTLNWNRSTLYSISYEIVSFCKAIFSHYGFYRWTKCDRVIEWMHETRIIFNWKTYIRVPCRYNEIVANFILPLYTHKNL